MINFTQGDTAVLELTAEDGDDLPIDLTGAVFETQILGPGGVVNIFPNEQHTANPDQVNFKGQYELSLTSDNTEACKSGLHKEIITQITIGGSVVYYHGADILTVKQNVPRQ